MGQKMKREIGKSDPAGLTTLAFNILILVLGGMDARLSCGYRAGS
jgi:hypothetical protein